ncbi:hypothetical protein Golob_026410, partial [Gossypium lobatum]|nr:hypothetical protein [Gossypium lobatum]
DNPKKVVIGKNSASLDQSDWDDLNEKTLSAIQLCLANNVLQEVLMEKMTSVLLKKLESFYRTQSLANWLVLKHRLYTLL